MQGRQGLILGIDTTEWRTELCLIELGSTPEVIGCCSSYGRETAEHLTKEIHLMLTKNGKTIAEIVGLGVAIGPGSFSGIRAGVAAAQGMALALDIPLIGVSTLLARVYQQAEIAGLYAAYLPANNKEQFVGLYQVEFETGHKHVREMLTCEAVEATELEAWLGEYASRASLLDVAAESLSKSSAQGIAQLACQFLPLGNQWQLLVMGVPKPVSMAEFSPLYVKRVNAKTIKERLESS